MNFHTAFRQRIVSLEEQDLLRELPETVPLSAINLSSNDYLGLSENLAFQQEFFATLPSDEALMGATSSRLLTGNSSFYKKIEDTLSEAYGREAALHYNSGYHANIGILPCIAQKKDLILADKLVHSSIIAGLKMGKASFVRYRHQNREMLEQLLQKNRSKYNNIFIVSESIFSMDGDTTDLKKLVELKQKYDARLYIDEAHAFGVRGEKGLGVCEEQGVIKEVDFIVGTFGKAIASMGAFVVCDAIFKQYLINRSHSLIFTTALPPINLAWTYFILQKLPHLQYLRKHLQNLSKRFSELIKRNEISHIAPYIVGENGKTVELAGKLREKGYWVLPIRSPTVPEGTARLRFSLTSNLSWEEIAPVTNLLK